MQRWRDVLGVGDYEPDWNDPLPVVIPGAALDPVVGPTPIIPRETIESDLAYGPGGAEGITMLTPSPDDDNPENRYWFR